MSVPLRVAILAVAVARWMFPVNCAAAQPAVSSVGWAERMVDEVIASNNSYGSNPTIVRWAEDGNGPARNRSVCSSFVTAVLERAYGFDDVTLAGWFGTRKPLAIDYARTVGQAIGFTRVARVSDLAAGDVLAIGYPPGSRPTGHVMIADGPARPRPATAPFEPQTLQYEITVIDSSKSYHGRSDTRFGAGSQTGGAGRGVLRLYARADGTLAGYSWSTRRVSTFYPIEQRPLVAGRYAGPPPRRIRAAATPAADSFADDDAVTGER